MRPTLAIRGAVTIGLLFVTWALGHAPLPALDHDVVARLEELMSGTGTPIPMSITQMGLGPAVDAFVFVELLALLVPRWRRLRADGVGGRRALMRSAVVFTVILTLAQAWFVTRFLARPLPAGLGGLSVLRPAPGLLAATIFALAIGSLALLAAAYLIDWFGIGCGFSLLLAASYARGVWPLAEQLARRVRAGAIETRDLALAVAAIAGTVVAAVVVLSAHRWRVPGSRRGRDSRVATTLALRLPASSLAPFALAAIAMQGWTSAMGGAYGVSASFARGPSFDAAPFVVRLVVLVVAGVALTYAFNRPRVLAEAVQRLDRERVKASVGEASGAAQGVADADEGTVAAAAIEDDASSAVRNALIATLGFLVILAVCELFAPEFRWPTALGVATIVVVVAAVLDVVREWRARAAAPGTDWTPAWALHAVSLLGLAERALADAGIAVVVRGAGHRALLHVFGPYVPISLFVPAARVEEAHRLLASVLVAPPAVTAPTVNGGAAGAGGAAPGAG